MINTKPNTIALLLAALYQTACLPDDNSSDVNSPNDPSPSNEQDVFQSRIEGGWIRSLSDWTYEFVFFSDSRYYTELTTYCDQDCYLWVNHYMDDVETSIAYERYNWSSTIVNNSTQITYQAEFPEAFLDFAPTATLVKDGETDILTLGTTSDFDELGVFSRIDIPDLKSTIDSSAFIGTWTHHSVHTDPYYAETAIIKINQDLSAYNAEYSCEQIGCDPLQSEPYYTDDLNIAFTSTETLGNGLKVHQVYTFNFNDALGLPYDIYTGVLHLRDYVSPAEICVVDNGVIDFEGCYLKSPKD